MNHILATGRRNSPLALLAASVLLVFLPGCDSTTSMDDSSESEPDIRGQVQEVLGSQVTDFQIREINVSEVAGEVESGETTLPFVTPDNEVVEMTMEAQPADLRPDSVDTGVLRGGEDDTERVPLPPVASFLLGNPDQGAPGGLTILDEDQTMLRGILTNSDFGVSYIQPVNLLLGSDEYPGQHVVYNGENTEPIEFGEEERPAPFDPPQSNGTGSSKLNVDESTSVVLDGDVDFYNIDQSTVWRRQENSFLFARLTTRYLEPNTSDDWELTLTIAGQEVWVRGGPSATTGDGLIDRLEDPGYFLLNPLSDKQIHLFFVGYNIGGTLLGQAGGFGNSNGWGERSRDPQSVTDNHCFAEARQSQGLHVKVAVATHEVGHLLGGYHGNAISSGCSGSACGRSIMSTPYLGSEEFFFSDANDRSISNVIDAILP